MLVGTKEFLEVREYFEKHQMYTKSLPGTYQYKEFWDNEVDKCMNGVQKGDLWIPGPYYFYLNYQPILGKDEITGRKKKVFPKFTDADLEYFKIVDRARKEKKGVIMTKPRRTGFSFKNSALVNHEYIFYRDAKCVIAAFESKLSENTMNMCLEGINFLDANTVWYRPRTPDTREFVKARHQKVVDGKPTWVGYNSEIRRLTFQNNPFSSIGLSSNIFLFEEAGLFENILESYNISEPCWKDGEDMVGIPILFGTAGDMEKGSLQFSEMFYNPNDFNLLAFDNIWEPEKSNQKCGWFLPATRNRFGEYKDPADGKIKPLIDEDGNSNEELARLSIMKLRDSKKNNPKGYRDSITQYPLTPSEAFLVSGSNIFPGYLLTDRLSELETDKSIYDSYWNVEFINKSSGEVEMTISAKKPIDKFPLTSIDDKKGCIQIFEQPYQDKPAYGIYLAGIDPYDDDDSQTDSLGSCIIMNSLTRRIVAEYTGRPETAKEFYENCRRLLLYYNALANYENNKKGLFSYFENNNCTYLLADTPKILKDQEVIRTVYSSGNNSKGTNATVQVNKTAREWLKTWMLEPAYNKEEGVKNANLIPSIPMVKEAIYWNPDGNFDRISALGMLMILLEDRAKIIIEDEEKDINTKIDYFDRHWKNVYRGNSYNTDSNSFNIL